MIYTHLAAAVIAALAVWFFQANHYEAELLELRLQHADAAILAAAQERIKQQAVTTKYEGALNAARTREDVLRRDARAARTESDSLRTQLSDAARRIADAPPAAVAEYATTVGDLYGECEAELTETAAAATGHASDVVLLSESWPVIPGN